MSFAKTFIFTPLTVLFVVVMAVVLIGVCVVLPLGALGYNAYRIVLQDHAIRTYKPTVALVTESRVQTRIVRGRKSSTTKYDPVIKYKYEVDGKGYAASHVTPLGDVDSRGPAEKLVADHPRGAPRKAWYDPTDPSNAFLVPHYSGYPYAWYFAGAAGTLVPLWLFSLLVFHSMPARRRRARAAGTVARLSTSTDPIPGEPRTLDAMLGDQVRSRGFQGFVFLALTWLGGWHLLTRIGADENPWLTWITLGVFTFVGLLYFRFARRSARILRVISDARVYIDPPAAKPGWVVTIRVEHDQFTPAEITLVRVGLVCTRTTGSGKNATTSKQWEQWHEEPAPVARTTAAGALQQRLAAMGGPSPRASVGTITVTARFQIPADAPPSSPDQWAGSPRYNWGVHVETTSPAFPKYKAQLAVQVAPAG
ncbi:MAG TPA: DUF3592 domain-containing protein [Tepidisphaeraceae bacterium]|nr:DUF3592 domain-containing protein [Tepidisphaeraceae bacterium]